MCLPEFEDVDDGHPPPSHVQSVTRIFLETDSDSVAVELLGVFQAIDANQYFAHSSEGDAPARLPFPAGATVRAGTEFLFWRTSERKHGLLLRLSRLV